MPWSMLVPLPPLLPSPAELLLEVPWSLLRPLPWPPSLLQRCLEEPPEEPAPPPLVPPQPPQLLLLERLGGCWVGAEGGCRGELELVPVRSAVDGVVT